MYENIKKAIAEHEAETLAQFAQSLENKTAAELLNSWQFRDRMTPATLQAMKNTDPRHDPRRQTPRKDQQKESKRGSKEHRRKA